MVYTETVKALVQITKQARRGLEKAPAHVRDKFLTWVLSVQEFGLEAVRQVPGYHDEPIQGQREGQRSIRLNKQWRAFYTETSDQQIVVTILEVTPHDYRKK